MLAATARVAGDIDVAEECVQDAYVAALDAGPRQGIPRNPGAWLTTTACGRERARGRGSAATGPLAGQLLAVIRARLAGRACL